MANPTDVKALIDANVTENNNNENTGTRVNTTLQSMVDYSTEVQSNAAMYTDTAVGNATQQATEVIRGTVKIATQTEVQTETTIQDQNAVTPKKYWQGIARFLQLSWNWAAKQIFNGSIQLNVGTPTAGKVWTATDSNGNGSWQNPSAAFGKFGVADSNGQYTFYTTIQAAINAAVSGQTVEVFADVIDTSNVANILKDGVTINGNGHTYTFNANTTTNAFETLTNASGSYKIIDLTIIRGSSTGANVIQDKHSSSGLWDLSGSSLILNSGGNACFYTVGSDFVLNNGYYESNGGFCIKSQSIVGTANNVICKGLGAGISVTKNVINSIINTVNGIALLTYNSIGNYAFSSSNTAAVIRIFADNCKFISNGVYGLQIGADNVVISNCNIDSNGLYGAYNAGFNNVEFSNNKINSNASFGLYAIGITKIYLNSITSSVSAALSGASASFFIYSNVIESNYNNSNGHAINFNSSQTIDPEVFDNTLKVANSAAYGIFSNATLGVKYGSNIFKNMTTQTLNITQNQTNPEDNFGNIKVN